MIPYASNTGTKRNLEALRVAAWRILLTPSKPKPRPGLRHAIDNGKWSCFNSGTSWDERGFVSLIEQHGGTSDFVVVPDIVGGGMDSLKLSLSWLPKLRMVRQCLLAVQDGMEVDTVGAVLRDWPGLGIFLGGTTEWKLRTMYGWGMMAHALGRWYHVGRVNTRRRIRLCAMAGATSFDGTSATRYCETLPELDQARKQPSLLTPRLIA